MGDTGGLRNAGYAAAAAEFFDAEWYVRHYPDVAGLDPWEHFLSFGDAERRSPGPRFDAEFYASTYLPLGAGGALWHFLREGRAAGFQPHRYHRSREESREAMRAAFANAANPIVLVGNDAQRAGAPLLMRETARHLSARDFSPIVVLLRAGPLLADYRAIGPTLILAEGFDLEGMFEAIPPGTPVLGNTVLTAPVLEAWGGAGPRLLLVHEMPASFVDTGLLEIVGRMPAISTPFPGMTSELAARLPAGANVSTIQTALLHVAVGPQSTVRVRSLIQAELGDPSHVFLSGGYADRRKGFDRFISIAHEIQTTIPDSGFVWLGELDAWATELAEAAVHAGLRLMLPGFRPDAAAWYDNTDVYLLTSREDPGPTTVVDAARRGVPFVAAPGDLGIRAMRETLRDVGVFCESEASVVGQAVDTARTDTAEARSRRAALIESFADFSRYVDELLDALVGSVAESLEHS